MKNNSYILWILCVLASADFRASGEAPGRMRDKDLLPGLENKVAVLEYENPRQVTWGLELSKILTREILGSISGVPSFGVVNLRQDDRRMELNPDSVIAIADRQKASIVIWGEFYESGEKIYLHSHLRVVPQKRGSETQLGLSYETPGGFVKASPASLLLNFSPVELSTTALKRLEESQQQSATIRLEPRDGAPEKGRLETNDRFGVAAVKDGWMQIQIDRGINGWVRYAVLENQAELNDLRAIVFFANGLMQYLTGHFDLAEKSISTYLDQFGDKQDVANQGFAHILAGNCRMQLTGLRGVLARGETITAEYLKAANLLPSQAAPVNYLAVARILKYSDQNIFVPEMSDLERRLIRVVQAQNDLEALDNLRALYKLAARSQLIKPQEMSVTAYSESISKQLTSLDEIAAKLRRQ